MFRIRRFWILCLTIFIIGSGIAYTYYGQVMVSAQQVAEEPEIQTTAVRRGDIIVSATGAGTVIPATEVVLGFPIGGVLTELLVQVGSEVEVEDILARLDDTDAQQAVANAELQLAQAIMRTDSEATEAGVSYNDITIQQARLTLAEAEATLDELLNWAVDEDDVAQAEANLEAAQAAYNAALGQESATWNNTQVSAINLEGAERDLADAQAAYDSAFDPGRQWERNIEDEQEAATASLIRAQDNLAIAQANYNGAVSGSNSSSSTSAQSSLLSAELALADVLAGPTAEEIEAAETAVAQAQLSLQQALLNQEADGLSLVEAQLNLQAAEATLVDTILKSPMAGTVMSIEANAGEVVGSGSLLILADLEQPILEIFLDETDLDKVGLGYEVEVSFDAFPDDLFIGHIIQVDPQLSDVNGITTIRAIVQLDTASFAKPQTLPVGLNATVEVIGGRAEGALLVPVEALREISPGQFAVFILEAGEPQLQFVEVGLMDFTFAEIIEGVALEDVVTTGLIDTGQ